VSLYQLSRNFCFPPRWKALKPTNIVPTHSRYTSSSADPPQPQSRYRCLAATSHTVLGAQTALESPRVLLPHLEIRWFPALLHVSQCVATKSEKCQNVQPSPPSAPKKINKQNSSLALRVASSRKPRRTRISAATGGVPPLVDRSMCCFCNHPSSPISFMQGAVVKASLYISNKKKSPVHSPRPKQKALSPFFSRKSRKRRIKKKRIAGTDNREETETTRSKR
jgi:hypothetical protein